MTVTPTLFITTITIFLILLPGGAITPRTALSQSTANTFESPINANAGITSGGNIAAPTSTISSRTAIFAGLSITSGTTGATIGDDINGKLYLLVEPDPTLGIYKTVIRSTTSIPIRLDGINKPIEMVGGGHIQSGTFSVPSLLEIRDGALNIYGATTTANSLNLHVSQADQTGLRVHVDTDRQKIHFKNSLFAAAGWIFDPTLTNLNDDAIVIYADSITMAPTDTTTLREHIETVSESVAWDQLLDASGTTTIKTWVADATNAIQQHFEIIQNSTGETIEGYIESRITARLGSITDLTISGTLTTNNLIVNNNATIYSATVENASATNFYVDGTFEIAPSTVLINWPTMDIDVTLLQNQISANTLWIENHEERIDVLENTVQHGDLPIEISGEGIIEVTHTIEDATAYWVIGATEPTPAPTITPQPTHRYYADGDINISHIANDVTFTVQFETPLPTPTPFAIEGGSGIDVVQSVTGWNVAAHTPTVTPTATNTPTVTPTPTFTPTFTPFVVSAGNGGDDDTLLYVAETDVNETTRAIDLTDAGSSFDPLLFIYRDAALRDSYSSYWTTENDRNAPVLMAHNDIFLNLNRQDVNEAGWFYIQTGSTGTTTLSNSLTGTSFYAQGTKIVDFFGFPGENPGAEFDAFASFYRAPIWISHPNPPAVPAFELGQNVYFPWDDVANNVIITGESPIQVAKETVDDITTTFTISVLTPTPLAIHPVGNIMADYDVDGVTLTVPTPAPTMIVESSGEHIIVTETDTTWFIEAAGEWSDGLVGRYQETVSSPTTTVYINHGLGYQDVYVGVRDTVTNAVVIPGLVLNATDEVRIGFATAPANPIEVVVIAGGYGPGTSSGVTDHGALTGLADNDHPQYLHKSIAGTVTAVHTFEPSSANPPFVLGLTAQGQLVDGFNADEWNGWDTLIVQGHGNISTVGDNAVITILTPVPTATAKPTPTPADVEGKGHVTVVQSATGWNINVPTPVPTATEKPEPTLAPSNTPQPTSTPQPTPTPYSSDEFFVFGDGVNTTYTWHVPNAGNYPIVRVRQMNEPYNNVIIGINWSGGIFTFKTATPPLPNSLMAYYLETNIHGTTSVVTHGLNSKDLIFTCYDASGNVIYSPVSVLDNFSVTKDASVSVLSIKKLANREVFDAGDLSMTIWHYMVRRDVVANVILGSEGNAIVSYTYGMQSFDVGVTSNTTGAVVAWQPLRFGDFYPDIVSHPTPLPTATPFSVEGEGAATVIPLATSYVVIVNTPVPTATVKPDPTLVPTVPTATEKPNPTPQPTVKITGSGAASVTPIDGGYNVAVPIPVPTMGVSGSGNITVTNNTTYYDVYAPAPPTPRPEVSLAGDGIVDVTKNSVNNWTIGVRTPVPTATAKPNPTPQPTVVITGSGQAVITPVAGGYNVYVPPLPPATNTPTVTPTFTPHPEVTLVAQGIAEVTRIAVNNWQVGVPTPVPTATAKPNPTLVPTATLRPLQDTFYSYVINGVATLTPDSATDVLNISAGKGITLSADVANDLYTITAKYEEARWNADKLQGYDIATSAPSSGQVLKWNGTEWAPGTDVDTDTDTNTTYSAANPITLTGTTFGLDIDGTTLLASGTSSELHANSEAAYWNAYKIQGLPVTTATPSTGDYAYYDGTSIVWAAPTPQPAPTQIPIQSNGSIDITPLAGGGYNLQVVTPTPQSVSGSGDDDFVSGTPSALTYSESRRNYLGAPLVIPVAPGGTTYYPGYYMDNAGGRAVIKGLSGVDIYTSIDTDAANDAVNFYENSASQHIGEIDRDAFTHPGIISARQGFESQGNDGINGTLSFYVPADSSLTQWRYVQMVITGGIITNIHLGTAGSAGAPSYTPVATPTPNFNWK